MEFRQDLIYSVSQYTGRSYGLRTLGEFQEIQLKSGKKIQLYPYLLETHCTRGVHRSDPRRRMSYDKAIPQLAMAYAEHYNHADLGEHWTTDEVEKMLHWQLFQSLADYFFVKWAKNLETNEEFPVGFFCAYTKPYQGGKMLWDGELFVLPEFRKHGIGMDLIEAMFTVAKANGIEFFESLTYEDEQGYPFQLWKNLGVESSNLIHMFGNTDVILSHIFEKSDFVKNKSLSIKY